MKDVPERIRAFNILPYLIIFYSVGFVGLIIPQTHVFFKALVPINLLLNLLLLIIYHGKLSGNFVWKSLLIIVASILVEMLGVNTGLIFGNYEYGATLGPQIINAPIIIGVNWLMLVYCSLVISSRFIENSYFRIILGAVIMVVYDFVLEPGAIHLGMWDWGGAIPLQNYISWLLIALVLIWFADRSSLVNRENKIALPLFFVQMGFFIILNFWMLIR